MGNIPSSFVTPSRLFDYWHPAYQFGWLRNSAKDYLGRRAWETPSGKTIYFDKGTMPMVRLDRFGNQIYCSRNLV